MFSKIISHASLTKGNGGLRYAVERAFANGARICWVDPNPENRPALALYRRLGMVPKEMPKELVNKDYPGYLYFEIRRQEWNPVKET